jgi:hypothetical protein
MITFPFTFPLPFLFPYLSLQFLLLSYPSPFLVPHLPFFQSLYLRSVSTLVTTYFPPESFAETFCGFPQTTCVIRGIESHDEPRLLPLIHFLSAQLPMSLNKN